MRGRCFHIVENHVHSVRALFNIEIMWDVVRAGLNEQAKKSFGI